MLKAGAMHRVEIRLASIDIAERMDAMRQWLEQRKIRPASFISTGSSVETVIIVEFAAADDAEAFAHQFSGSLTQS